MLKIYKTYLQYQTDGSGWEQFGYSDGFVRKKAM